MWPVFRNTLLSLLLSSKAILILVGVFFTFIFMYQDDWLGEERKRERKMIKKLLKLLF